ncbi:WD40 repeat-like protein [Neolentinus lepideus HHB14362 ss-1]|uniref:Protein HIR n=1 Tax=Neolentinus lepideus HHB14362 ss-1 TaxID=1314782 RepID=A0A165UF99_9AGAM|nr:WD40 repeat-like protein [Neolentinus lepideus HHB14362 ss-1]
MRFTKPAWVAHKDTSIKGDQTKRLSIFSVHVHPDDSRIATGGLDAKVRIWSIKPILSEASELSNKPPKALCSLTMHTGPVLCVRWAHSGRWLASGSDDQIVMIWDLDPSAKGKVWGSDEVNVEGWKPMKRLPGHESDVTDLAWSPGDRYLASVGLDSQVIVWCGYTLERLHKLDLHNGFVKGVCWDPVGEFLATQSDDRSVKIWRTTDWGLEAEIRKPFEDSPGSTFFRRLSWSPDGAHITASNATNNKGFVFIAAVIARNTWTSEISLVGHENTVEVACYNPHIFLRDPDGEVKTSNICSVVALGADDRSVSVWQTKSARPLIVAKEAFDRQIMDLSWSWDGLTLYAVSSDGTLGVFNFDREELEGIAPFSAQKQYLHKFGFIPSPIPDGYSHTSSVNSPAQVVPTQQTGFDSQANEDGGERINKLVAKRKDKKRIVPTSLRGSAANIPSASIPSASNSEASFRPPPSTSRSFEDAHLPQSYSAPAIRLPPPPMHHISRPSSPSTSTVTMQTLNSFADYSFDVDMDRGMDVRIEALDDSTSWSGKGKRKSSAPDLMDDSSRPSRPRTLGGDRPREQVVVKEIVGRAMAIPEHGWVGVPRSVLSVPALLTYLSTKVEGSGSEESVFEAKNSDNADNFEVVFVSRKQTQWLDYLPSATLALAATNVYCACASDDGSVNVYSPQGRRLMPTLALGSPPAFFDGSKGALMAITASGMLYVWDVKKRATYFAPVSIQSLLEAPGRTVRSASVRPNGAPVIQMSNGVAYSYDCSLSSWVKLSERWWAAGSDAWQGRQRANTQVAARGIVSSIEGELRSPNPGEDGYIEPGQVRPGWWNIALTLGHLETKIHSAKAMDSPQEFKQVLLVYAKKIADEGFRGKAEELIKELFGPVYWRPGKDDSWSPTVLGFSKRDLLRDVLNVFARSRTLTKLAIDWQDTLKKASVDE